MKPTTESRWKRNAVRLLSTIAILGLFLLYSYKPLVSRGGFVHIDTGPTILISEEAASSGRFWLNEPLNAVFPYPLFTRQASTNLTNDPTKIVPVGPLGIHVIAATRSATNDMVPFLIISAIGVLGAVCLFYLVQNLFGRWELSLLSTALYSTFPSVAYWNNFLIPNLPALSLLLASTYFFHRGLLRRDKRYYLASSALLAAAIWLRYELAIVPIITLPVALLYFRKQWKDFALIGLIVAALLSPIAALNTEIYGDPMKMGYILKPGSTETTAFDLLRVPMHIDLQILATNLSTEVVHRSTLLFVATLPGLAIYIKRYRSKGIHSDTVLLPWTFFSLYILLRIGTASSLGGYGQTVQISSYSRYFSYLAPLLSILSAVAIFEIFNRAFTLLARKSRKFVQGKPVLVSSMVFLVAASYSAASIAQVAHEDLGLIWATEEASRLKAINDRIAELADEDAIVITDVYSSYITSRKTFWIYRVPPREYRTETPTIVSELIGMGRQVLLIEDENHPWFLDIQSLLEQSDAFEIQTIDESTGLQQVTLRGE